MDTAPSGLEAPVSLGFPGACALDVAGALGAGRRLGALRQRPGRPCVAREGTVAPPPPRDSEDRGASRSQGPPVSVRESENRPPERPQEAGVGRGLGSGPDSLCPFLHAHLGSLSSTWRVLNLTEI